MEICWQDVSQEAPEWFRDAKFGMFFHWGPYSVPACENEWYSRNIYAKGSKQNLIHEQRYGKLKDFGYKDFIPMFRGEHFTAEVWADLVELAGARYAGPVTEHADNFSLWDSKINPVNSMNCGPHRDVVGECAESFRKRGIKLLATFHHQWLWGWFMSTDPDADVYAPQNEKFYWKALPLETNRYIPFRLPDREFNDMWLDKIKEVVGRYRPDVLYFDSRMLIIDEYTRFKAADYYYNTCGIRNGIITFKQEDLPRDTGVINVECGRFADVKDFPWQTDDRLEDNITWCIVENPKYKSATRILHQLCDIVAKNGNLLLNVGPNADGTFPESAVNVLQSVGDWLRLNGEAIYGTRPFSVAAEGPSISEDTDYNVERLKAQLKTGIAMNYGSSELTAQDFRFTKGNDAIYAIGLGWPEDGIFRIKTLKKSGAFPVITRIDLIGKECPLAFDQSTDCLTVHLPEAPPCEHAYVLKIR